MLLGDLNELKYFSVNFFYVFLALMEQFNQREYLKIAKKISYMELTATLIKMHNSSTGRVDQRCITN